MKPKQTNHTPDPGPAFLDRLRKHRPDGTDVPAGYFDQLHREMMQRVEHEASPLRTARTVRLRIGWRWTAAAAAIALLFGAFWWLQPTKSDVWSEVSDDALYAYVSEHLDDFETDEAFFDGEITFDELIDLESEAVESYLEEADWITSEDLY